MIIPGSRIGAYEIVSLLGAGGMGEVYRARDTKLQRDVALKVLSATLAQDLDAAARFEREALSVARLSHPNILAIHEFARHEGTAFVVTELVEGETLRARLAHGALPPRRAVAYALQIARGMAAAHGRGIVHRDLKPENVMITRDDQVKILDFGLAKPIESAPATEVTRPGTIQTNAGTVLGTFAYMAPEQVRGLAVDHRADMFAFGAVLYEMLSGERAFKGDTAADTMTAILTKEPPELDTARVAISPALDRIVRRCLEKTPDLRFQSANDLAFALETLSTSSSSSSASPVVMDAGAVKHRGAVLVPWAIAGVAIAAAVAIWMLKPGSTPMDPAWQHFTPVTDAGGEETTPALSPDGTTVAYAIRVKGSWDIYMQRVGGRNATPIVNDPARNESGPAYSPDGSMIAFHESDNDGGIFIAGATGESVRRVTDAGFDAAWSPDGKQLVFATEEAFDPASRQTSSGIYTVDVAGGTPKLIIQGDGMQPSWSPSGERIAYWSNTGGQRDLFTVPAAGGARVAVTNDAAIDWCPVWSPDGRYIYFSSDRGGAMNLWRVAVDQSTGRVTSAAEPVTNGVQASAALPRFSKDGSRFAFRSRVGSINPVAIPFDPVTLKTGVPVVLDGSNNIRVPSDVSPDGTRIVYFSIGERQEDVFFSAADGGGMRRLTDDVPRDRGPVFTRDGRSLLFYSNRDGNWAIWTIHADGSGLRKLAGVASGAIYAIASPLDDSFVFSSTAAADGVYLASLSGSAVPVRLANTSTPVGFFLPTAWSRNGALLAGPIQSPGGAPSGVGVYDLGKHETSVLTSDATWGARWLPDNRRLIYFSGTGNSDLIAVDAVTRQRTVVAHLPWHSTNDVFGLAPDGRTIYYGAAHAEADIWIAERR